MRYACGTKKWFLFLQLIVVVALFKLKDENTVMVWMYLKECYATNEARKILILKLPIYIDKNESNSLALLYNFGSVNGKINLSTIKVTTKLCRRKKYDDAVTRILLQKW